MKGSRTNILVTGGFGFIGSWLVEQLVADRNNHVHVVDNLSTSPIHLPSYLDHLGRPDNLTYDLRSIDAFHASATYRANHIDQIYHLASVVGPVGVLQHAGRIADLIINDTYRIIDIALAHGARLIDVSTSEIYGGGRDGYCAEDFSRIIPAAASVRLEYAVAKLASEIALVNTSRVQPLSVSIVRPFNVAGPRQSPRGGFVLPRFLQQALKGEPLTVYNDGAMIRAFTDVRDIVQGLVLVMERGRPGEAYNIGNPANRVSILELAERVVAVTGTASPITFVDPKALFGPLFEEANDKYPDASRATNELGWCPHYLIDTIIAETYAYISSGSRA